MKKLFTIVGLLVSVMGRGQCGLDFTINIDFDDTCYRNFITIDTVNYHHNLWQVGKPHKTNFVSAFTISQPNAIVTDTLNPYGDYDTSVFYVKIPLVNHDGWPLEEVSFFYKTDVDTGETIKVELSSDTLLQWKDVITDTLPYGLSNVSWDTGKFQLFTPDWKLFVVHRNWPPAPYDHDTMLMRFTFISDSSVSGKDGWMIDFVNFTYWFEESIPLLSNPNLITLYPNPSHGNIYIHTDKPHKGATITVHDMQGRQVYSGAAPLNGYLNLQLPNGVYTLKYSDEEEYCVKRIVIQN